VVSDERSFSPANSKLPIQPLPSPKARLKATTAHRMLTIAIEMKFCMSMSRTFLARTMPP
jgi:hypothetical protein